MGSPKGFLLTFLIALSFVHAGHLRSSVVTWETDQTTNDGSTVDVQFNFRGAWDGYFFGSYSCSNTPTIGSSCPMSALNFTFGDGSKLLPENGTITGYDCRDDILACELEFTHSYEGVSRATVTVFFLAAAVITELFLIDLEADSFWIRSVFSLFVCKWRTIPQHRKSQLFSFF